MSEERTGTPDDALDAPSAGSPQEPSASDSVPDEEVSAPWVEVPGKASPPKVRKEKRDRAEKDRGRKEKRKKRDRKGKKEGGQAIRGVETLFRTMYRTHLDLGAMADAKANILITVNGVLISILLATVASTVSVNQWLLVPFITQLATSSATLVFAVLAVRPRITRETTRPEDLQSGKRNFLFFGNFVNMEEEDFLMGIRDLVGGGSDLYSAMARDLYSLGEVLDRKYRMIRIAYTIFMFGLVGSGFLFAGILLDEALR